MISELQFQIRHLEALNSKLLPDLENYEAQIYELGQEKMQLNVQIKEKERECYNLQSQLNEAHNKISLQEQVIEQAGAQKAMAEALLEKKELESQAVKEVQEI